MKPQLRFQMVYDLPVYATSDAWDPSTHGATDMDGLTFPEMPWRCCMAGRMHRRSGARCGTVEDGGARSLAALPFRP
jgi:outer membrane PBP1 activator LpoA protein